MIRVEITIEDSNTEYIHIREEVPYHAFEVEDRAEALRQLSACAMAKALAADAAKP